MARDYGSRDPEFTACTTVVRAAVAKLIGDPVAYVCVPLQGSGTFAVEATIGTLVPPGGKLLVIVNGAYGRRIVTIAQRIGRQVVALVTPETSPPDLNALVATLSADPEVTHVAVIHCETTTGMLNPLSEIASIVARHGRRLLVDAMSAFGAIALDAHQIQVDAVMGSSNKCLEGVPGVGLVVVRAAALSSCEGNAHSLALDLFEQQRRFERDGQWRFTPPTQVMAALAKAVAQHTEEGGVAGRGARYRSNLAVLVSGMRSRGFRTLLPDHLQAPIIVTFHQPRAPFVFEEFYDALNQRGFAIYPGKLTEAPTFRVGCIGQVFPDDIRRFMAAVDQVMNAQGWRTGAPEAGTGGF